MRAFLCGLPVCHCDLCSLPHLTARWPCAGHRNWSSSRTLAAWCPVHVRLLCALLWEWGSHASAAASLRSHTTCTLTPLGRQSLLVMGGVLRVYISVYGKELLALKLANGFWGLMAIACFFFFARKVMPYKRQRRAAMQVMQNLGDGTSPEREGQVRRS